MTLAFTIALVTGCAAITDAELAERIDRDGDGEVAQQWGGTDCDDGDRARNDGAVEVCNSVDDDCNGTVDDVQVPEGTTYYLDVDEDGFGSEAIQACSEPAEAVLVDGDCDDSDAAVRPDVTEVCDGIDNDCDGLVDDDDDLENQTWYGDDDEDGYGDPDVVLIQSGCETPDGYTSNGDDCNDDDASVHQGGTEVCNDMDDDCNGLVDEDDPALEGSSYYPDQDNDDYGSASGEPKVFCTEPLGYSDNKDDCQDLDGDVNPAAPEICNHKDDDCDGSIDVGAEDAESWYVDADHDGYGTGKAIVSCEQPPDTSRALGDCDDADTAYHPFADEECDGTVDYNCDSSTGADDADKDGFVACNECDDANPDVNPAAQEICNAGDIDYDCDETVGDDDESTDPSTKTLYYDDVDGDHYGDENDPGTLYCHAPADTVTNHTDCDDASDTDHPGAVETWYNGDDDACDGGSDYDRDSDGYDSDTVGGGSDCDDSRPDVNPGIDEKWYDGLDADCSGGSDYDKDGDGYDNEDEIATGTDCDDENGAISPGAAEDLFTVTVDEDCDGNPIL